MATLDMHHLAVTGVIVNKSDLRGGSNMDAEARRQQHEERTKIREAIARSTRRQEREHFKAITGIWPYTEEWRFFNEGRG